jgi:hypothetical protein
MTCSPGLPADRSADFRPSPAEIDWSLLADRRPNVLLSGPGDAAHAFIDAVTPYLQSPVQALACDAHLKLPPGDGTVILDCLDALDRDQQRELLEWLDDPRRAQTQVISISPTPLYASVERDTFLSALYYRLNVIYLEVRPV